MSHFFIGKHFPGHCGVEFLNLYIDTFKTGYQCKEKAVVAALFDHFLCSNIPELLMSKLRNSTAALLRWSCSDRKY